MKIENNKQFDKKLTPHYIKSHDQSLSHANPQYQPQPHTFNFLTQTVYPSYFVNILYIMKDDRSHKNLIMCND